jgi:predicted ferric reductase
VNHEFWYLSRAAGFTAFGLLFFSVALGIMIGTRLTGRFSRNTVFDIHRFTSILALAFSFFHVYILLGDSYFKFSVWQLSLPFASPYQAWQTAAGGVAFYLLLLVVASFYLRSLIGHRTWRAIHFLTFALFGLAMLHGITAGTDAHAGWAELLYAGAGTTVLALVLYRVQHHLPAESNARRLRFTAGAISTAGSIALLLLAIGLGSESERTVATASPNTVATILDQRAELMETISRGRAESSDDERHVRNERDVGEREDDDD